jgi:hypothetical protein
MSFIRRLLGDRRRQNAAADFISRASHGLARDNFEYIAVNAGTFWAILNESYSSRFGSEKAKLAACAYLVLSAYMEQGRLGPADVELAVLCASQGECSAEGLSRAHENRSMEMILFGSETGVTNLYEPRVLLNLTLQLEVLAFCADNDEMIFEGSIVDTVIEKKAVVARVLSSTEKAIREGKLPFVEPIRSFAAGVLASPRFASTMSEIGVSNLPGT